jgi:Zn-dependent M28 family amino/carboxypeptidase
MKMMKALAVSILLTTGAAVPLYAQPKIDAAQLSQIDKELSADSFEGRGPASRAEPKVINYIVAHYKALGLKPGGSHGSWTQAVPMRRYSIQGTPQLSVTLGGTTHALVQGDDLVATTQLPVDQVHIKGAPLVFCGYGVKAAERGWDDFKGIDLRGKIMVVLINDPDFEATPADGSYTLFDGKSMTYYGRWTYKFEEAARQGALGILIVHETAPAAYDWGVVKNSNITPRFDIVRKVPQSVHPLMEGWVTHETATKIFQAGGLDFDALKKTARQKDFQPVEIKSARFSADYAVKTEQVITHNILGKIAGTAHPQETIMFSAHWDHLGIGPADAHGDTIYNGALDNASGVAGMLELARAFSHAPAPKRSLVFMAVTAEEKGLLGAEYYGQNPIYPLATTVADFNLDGLQIKGPAHDFGVQGFPKNMLVDRLEAEGKRQGRVFSPDPEPEKGHFFRADHFAFARQGVPAVTLDSGIDLLKGGKAAGMAARTDFVVNHYHQPSDEWSPAWDWSGAAQDVQIYFNVAQALAMSHDWLEWHADSEFKAVRDKSKAARK